MDFSGFHLIDDPPESVGQPRNHLVAVSPRRRDRVPPQFAPGRVQRVDDLIQLHFDLFAHCLSCSFCVENCGLSLLIRMHAAETVRLARFPNEPKCQNTISKSCFSRNRRDSTWIVSRTFFSAPGMRMTNCLARELNFP